jgi:hypothetical protein
MVIHTTFYYCFVVLKNGFYYYILDAVQKNQKSTWSTNKLTGGFLFNNMME